MPRGKRPPKLQAPLAGSGMGSHQQRATPVNYDCVTPVHH
eukprot:CAMPEP_0204136498 /NCGR_PEP_ID=MMETSP0361-20130328/16863_1 /ASSEMBLY_ACC=CAM_ASM_000343 /TAXON_ID=268821 /ORGANISM="Scrippsiella Hangoei, Strain SHTV-5" /LENGTH=39 /DNA_ID= /DNA_START= /DNA_END= /DNA_ORIENTATION=